MTCKNRAKNCGGCPLLEVPYPEQLKQKEAKVRALLGKYGPVHPIRGMEMPTHYRNKVISTFATGSGGKLVSGIYAAKTHKVLPVERCLLEDEVLDTAMEAVRAAAAACKYQPYNEDKGTGLLRHCLLRRGVAGFRLNLSHTPLAARTDWISTASSRINGATLSCRTDSWPSRSASGRRTRCCASCARTASATSRSSRTCAVSPAWSTDGFAKRSDKKF